MTINLSILDFKFLSNICFECMGEPINLSILDFKYVATFVQLWNTVRYKSIHIGF